MELWNFVKIVPGNELLPDGTKPLPEPMLSVWTIWNTLQWYFTQDANFFIQEHAPQSVFDVENNPLPPPPV